MKSPYWVTIGLTESELAIVRKWTENYLTSGMPPTPQGAIKDMLSRISDDMREMEEEGRVA